MFLTTKGVSSYWDGSSHSHSKIHNKANFHIYYLCYSHCREGLNYLYSTGKPSYMVNLTFFLNPPHPKLSCPFHWKIFTFRLPQSFFQNSTLSLGMPSMHILYQMILTCILTITFTKGRKDFSFRHSSAAASFAADSSTREDRNFI